MKITGKLQANTRIHSFTVRGTTPKILAKIGTYKMTQWESIEPMMARMSHGFTQGGICNKLPSSETALRAFSISIVTSTDKLRVMALALPMVK